MLKNEKKDTYLIFAELILLFWCDFTPKQPKTCMKK